MGLSYLRFALLLSILWSLRARLAHEAVTDLAPQSLPEEVLQATDPETLLAAGERFPFACADMVALELINGVSDRLALELLDQRARISRAVAAGASEEHALQFAKGVGVTTARKLLQHISLSSACTPTESYQPLDRAESAE